MGKKKNKDDYPTSTKKKDCILWENEKGMVHRNESHISDELSKEELFEGLRRRKDPELEGRAERCVQTGI